MKTNHGASRVASAALMALALLLFAALPVLGQAPQVRVEATADATATRIEAKATGPFEYTTYRPSETLFVVDLAGVTSAVPAGARVLKSDTVSSYRVLQYRSGEMAIVRVEMLMRSPVEPRVERVGSDRLVISFAGSGQVLPAAVRTSSPALAPARQATWIEDVKVERRDEQTSVVILANGKLSYEALRLNNPERLVLDFGGTKVRAQQRTFGGEHAPVSSVRLGQFKPAVSRVVIDLDRGLPYRVNEGANSVTVIFGDATTASVSAPLASPVRTEAPALVSRSQSVARSRKTPPKSDLAAPAISAHPTMALTLPEHLTNPAFALARPTPPAPSDPPAAASPAPAAAVPASLAQGKKYEGEPISVNFKDVDLKDFFRLIHEISGLNVVVDPNVKGTLTIVLEEVPWDQALDIALKNNNLDKQVEGNVLRIATRSTLKKEAEEKRDLIKAEAEAIPAETRTYMLSYAKATGMRDTLKRFLSSRGEIIADERSNTLIVRDIPSVFPQIEDLRSQLDRKTQQVEIEARVVAATRTFARDVGTQFGFATSSTGGRSIFGGVVGSGAMVSPVIHPNSIPPVLVASGGQNQIPLMSNLGATAPTSGASFIHSSPNFALDFILTAAESKGVGKLLSKPKIFTQNNKTGTVMQGTKIPLQTSVNNTITVTYIDAVLKLTVTPQITAEGTIFLEIIVENTDIDEGVPRILGIPALTTQKAETNILVNDGGTVVLGGVMVTSQRTDVQQVPLLGSIPLLGHLFKKTAVASDSQELMFFVTPRIIPN
jgi:type IV pilus assembly protein PilQ